MSAVIIAIGFANGVPCPHEGMYLESFDFDAHDGQGWGEFTRKLSRAKTFADAQAAAEFWKTQSRVKPIRDDGKPNRPLTALSVEIKDVP